MSFFLSKFDTQVAIFLVQGPSPLTGLQSEFIDQLHPATGNEIIGFKFDRTYWTNKTEDNDLFIAPTLWDQNLTGLTFKSGVGDLDDCLVLAVEIEHWGNNAEDRDLWLPHVNHGYYYDRELEHYLFSDDSVVKYPARGDFWVSELDPTISGGNYVNLDFLPKPGIPILANTYKWDTTEGKYLVWDSADKVTEFTTKLVDDEYLLWKTGDEILWDNLNTSQLEFWVDYLNSGIIFNREPVVTRGRILTTFVGTSEDELAAMELVGTLTDDEFQEFNLLYSPVDQNSPLQVVVVESGINAQEYYVVSGFTVSGSNEVIIDYDLGLLQFGSAAAGGQPPEGLDIYAAYSSTRSIEYEPVNTRDWATDKQSDINPVTRFTANGFVFIKQHSDNPANLVLEAELPLISTDYFGPLNLGNNYATLVATVTELDGTPVEGQLVFFEILDGPDAVRFNTALTTSAVSNADGEATALLSPPVTIDDMGGYTNELTYLVPSGTQLFIENYTPPTDEEDLFLFQVHVTDDILGIPKADLLSFYEDFIIEQGTDSTQTHGPLIDIDLGTAYSWIAGAYEDFIKWEILHRAFHNLQTPVTYETDDISTGKKTVIAVLDNAAVNPHTGTTPAFVPLQPSGYEIVESGVYVTIDQNLPPIDSTTKSYQIVGPTVATVRAYTTNERTGETIYSNTIEILIDIPDSRKGLYNIDTINSVPSGLLGNARFWDQQDIELESVNITASGLLPIGWRIRSPGITIASALDSITFLDINPLTNPDDTLDHEFEVEV